MKKYRRSTGSEFRGNRNNFNTSVGRVKTDFRIEQNNQNNKQLQTVFSTRFVIRPKRCNPKMRPGPVPGHPALHTYTDHGGLKETNGLDDDCNGRMRRPNCRQLTTTRRAERKPDLDLRQSKQAMNRKRVYEIIEGRPLTSPCRVFIFCQTIQT